MPTCAERKNTNIIICKNSDSDESVHSQMRMKKITFKCLAKMCTQISEKKVLGKKCTNMADEKAH